jgi:hypothetical protein
VKRLITLVVLGLLATAIAATPALADPPGDFTVVDTLYGEPDPCHPGETMDVTFTYHVQEMANRNTLVWVVDSYAESTRGYVANGVETQVVNKKWLIDRFNWQNVNPETGDRFTVKGRFKIDLESAEAVQEEFSMTCLGKAS